MENLKKFLHDLIGIEGFGVLEKAIYKRGSQSVLDPSEFMLPLIVAPRAILSWLVQNIKPMSIGAHKTFDFPGRTDIKLWVQKQDTDVYRGEFVQGGKIVQTFDRQSLPTIAMTMMTTGELYDHLNNEKADEPEETAANVVTPRSEMIEEHENLIDVLRGGKKDELKEEADKQAKELEDYKNVPKDDSSGMVRYIMDCNDINITINNGQVQDLIGNNGVKQAVSVIGALVDALVGRKIEKDKQINKLIDPSRGEVYEDDPIDLLEEDNNMDKKEIKVSHEVQATKAEMPSGAAVPKAPAAPKPPVPPSMKKPQTMSAKQASLSAQGKQPQPLKQPQQKQVFKDDMSWTGADGYFRKKLKKQCVTKKEKVVTLSHDDLFAPCVHCGASEFKKDDTGKVSFKPCACFQVEKTERKDKQEFVTLSKNNNDTYSLAFAQDADPESVKAFLLTLKAQLLVEKRLNHKK